jgi:alcohol dehydrogenase class IV
MDYQTPVNWNYPANIVFGPGTIGQLPALCQTLGIKRPLIISDEGLASSPLLEGTAALLETEAVFTGVKGNPTGNNVAQCVQVLKDGGHDGVIAFGGGSAIDAAKAAALMAGQSRPLWDFEDVGDNWKRVDTAGMLPVIAVPTTAGTGSEVGRASVITNEQTHEKKIIFHPQMMPEYVILDPVLTKTLPAHLTAATGIDAFIHAFEAYCAPTFHPMADGIALEAMALIAKYLPRAYKDGQDLEARAHMLVASSMGATAFQKGLGGIHALAHPLGALYDKHHGLLNAILWPYVMQANKMAIADKCIILGRRMNIDPPGFESLYQWALEFRQQLGIPHTLSEIGINKDQLDKIAHMATQDPSSGGNPAVLDAPAYQGILENALTGSLYTQDKAA